MASHHASNGDARSEFIEWSTQDEEFADQADAIGRRWDSLHREKTDGVTYRTLNKLLYDAGKPNLQIPGKASDDFDAVPHEDNDLDQPTPNGLNYELFSAIDTVEVEWLWRDRFAVGKLGLIAGYPEDGKSTMLLDIAARITRGDDWPDGSGNAPKGAVIILSSEDDAGDTIKPRLIAAGADVTQCVYIPSLVKVENGRRVFNLVDDLSQLKATIDDLRAKRIDVKLVILDPINAYLGGKSKGDAWKTSDMRAILTPLTEWAMVVKVSVIGISHYSKHSGNSKAIHRIVDSQAITAATRSVWVTDTDRDDPAQKLLLRGKVNIGKPVPGLAYSVVSADVPLADGRTITAPRIEWRGVDAQKLGTAPR